VVKVKKYLTRMGDGQRVEMAADELMRDFELGTQDAAGKGKIAPLSKEDLEQLLEIFTNPCRIVAVEAGNEVPLTHDIGTLRLMGDQANSGVGIPLSRLQGVQVHERAFAADTMELGHIDYSFKPVKPVISMEQQEVENTLLSTIVPIFYGAMPNLGLYYSPDGPYGNPSDLLPKGKIKEAREAQEGAVEHAVRDMCYIGEKLAAVGCDGINFDTTGAAGDADFKATLHAVEHLKKNTNMAIEVGMAGEFVLGIHGELEYDGQRLAGKYCHQQVKLAEKAGADIFGPVVNTKPSKSFPWNLARAVTFIKACTREASIPIHVNVGMGVGGGPVFETPPIDCVTRVSKAMVEIAKADGL
jgi:dimethylamine--corrinoid protein Co-methyltransferase